MKWLLLLLACVAALSASGQIASHPPIRPFPKPVDRPLTGGSHKFVDSNRGLDSHSGTKDKPWKTLAHAIEQLKPGDTLYLRGGTFYERVSTSIKGTRDKPIIIASYPGELAVVDGSIREFYESPHTAWEPYPEGAKGEYRSTKAYPELGGGENRTNLLGNFGDTMVPLFGYRFLTDLRSNNHKYKDAEAKTEVGKGVYCGPGVYLDPETHRIHIRLAHTQQPSIGEANNYRGETDPRKLPLVIAGNGGSALELKEAEHVTLGDLVVRGSREATINIEDSLHIILDGVTSFGGSSALRIKSTQGLSCYDTAFRGIAAPWIWRWSLKYRAIESRIVSASQWNPPARGNKDFTFQNCEFTDSVDGVFIGNVEECTIHQCYLDNVSDDGFFLTSRTAYDGDTPSGELRLNHNRISRVLSALAFGVGHGRQRTINQMGDKQLGAGCLISGNVFDLRDPVLYQQPEEGHVQTFGRIAGDHGSPIWEPMDFVSNTVYTNSTPWRNYYAAGLGRAINGGTSRSIILNRFIHETGMPGEVLPEKEVKLQTQLNLHWSIENGKNGEEVFLKRFRTSKMYEATGWTKDDVYISPENDDKFLGANPNEYVGIWSRLTIKGNQLNQSTPIDIPPLRAFHPILTNEFQKTGSNGEAAMVLGYPAFDAPILQFAMEKSGAKVRVFEKVWLPIEEFSKYNCVVYLGSTTRAKMEPSGFKNADHAKVLKYLKDGGTMIIGRELMRQLFPEDEGKRFIESLSGTAPTSKTSTLRILEPHHPWINHFMDSSWKLPGGTSAIVLSKGKNLIGDPKTHRSILADIPVGKGRLIYVGWDIAKSLPEGRNKSTVAQEEEYLRQYQIYEKMVKELLQ